MKQTNLPVAEPFHLKAQRELYRRNYRLFAAEQETILPKDGKPCRLNLNPLQTIIDDVAQEQWRERGFIRIVIFKARQRGGTTYSVSRAAWRAYLNSNISAIIISCDDDSTKNAFRKAELMYTEMSPWLRPMRRYLTKEQIVLENPDNKTRADNPGLRSRIECATAKNMNAGVSTTRQVVCMSEMPRWARTEEIRSSLLPTVPDAPGTIIINEATPYGWGKGREEFRDWCDSARSGKDEFKLIELYWHMDPELRVARGKNEKLRLSPDERYWKKKCQLDDEQILWRRREIIRLGKTNEDVGEMLFLQEYPSDYESAWQSFEHPAFDRVKLEEQTRRTVKNPIRRCTFEVKRDGTHITAEFFNSGGDLWIWEEPEANEMYDIGADCAPPTGSSNKDPDFCAFVVIKRSDKSQVAEWRGHPNVHDFAAILYCIGRYYNDAHLGVEVNGIGYAVNEQLCLLLYPNIYQWRLRQHAVPKYSPLTGWKTQDDTKKLMMAVVYRLIDYDELCVRSERLRDEMRNYIHYESEAGNDKWDAGQGHDDLFCSFAIAQVISRDEDAMGGGNIVSIGGPRMLSLKERNAEIAEFMQKYQPGLSQHGADLAFGPSKQHDAWDRLAKSYGGRGGEDFES